MNINKVTLLSSKLNETKDFYQNTLQFKVIDSSEEKFTINVGKSLLEFQEEKNKLNPFYHFAFNIPPNKFQEAKQWAKDRVGLLVEDGEDEVYFKGLNAHSFYFYDPSGNIVELIARHSDSKDSNEAFSAQSIINISEINLTTYDVTKVGKDLISNGILARDGMLSNDGLNFMGSEGSYLLLGPPKRVWFFSTKEAKPFPLTITINQQKVIKGNDVGEVSIRPFY